MIADQNQTFGSYVHNNFNKKIGQIGRSACLVQTSVSDGSSSQDQVGPLSDDLALHIYGLRPNFISRNQIPESLFESWKKEVKLEIRLKKKWAIL